MLFTLFNKHPMYLLSLYSNYMVVQYKIRLYSKQMFKVKIKLLGGGGGLPRYTTVA